MTTEADDGYSCARDYQLFGPGPKRVLALDGGGVRGAITVAFLERIEALLSEHRGRPVRLGDYFNLVGGTSTGAVIAGAMALGHTTAEIKRFYLHLAPQVFVPALWRIPGLQAKFDASALRREIDAIVKDRRLDSPDLITGLCVVTKRLDTGSPWILANNPRAPYWESVSPDKPRKISGHTGNRHYRLANLVRASTAAPHYFDPEVLAIIEDERQQPLADLNARLAGLPRLSLLVSKLRARRVVRKDADARGSEAPAELEDISKGLDDTYGLFVDGGVTPYNNPVMALLMMTQLSGFGIKWPLGVDKLSIISIGTGSHRGRLSLKDLRWFGPLKVTMRALLSMMGDAQTLALAQMQWLGHCPQPWVINSEIGDLAQDGPPGGKWFHFLRYDVHLETAWLKEHLGASFSDRDVERFRRMDDPRNIETIYELARSAAEKQVRLEHLLTESDRH